MIGAFVIAFREVIEAGLIISIVLAATRGIPGRMRWVLLGVAGELRAAGAAVRSGEREAAALSIVIGAAILREGAELVLFLYGLVASGTSGADIQFGAVAGIGAGVLLSAVTYLGLASIPSRYVFSVTSVLIVFLAAGLAAQAAQFLANAGVVD